MRRRTQLWVHQMADRWQTLTLPRHWQASGACAEAPLHKNIHAVTKSFPAVLWRVLAPKVKAGRLKTGPRLSGPHAHTRGGVRMLCLRSAWECGARTRADSAAPAGEELRGRGRETPAGALVEACLRAAALDGPGAALRAERLVLLRERDEQVWTAAMRLRQGDLALMQKAEEEEEEEEEKEEGEEEEGGRRRAIAVEEVLAEREGLGLKRLLESTPLGREGTPEQRAPVREVVEASRSLPGLAQLRLMAQAVRAEREEEAEEDQDQAREHHQEEDQRAIQVDQGTKTMAAPSSSTSTATVMTAAACKKQPVATTDGETSRRAAGRTSTAMQEHSTRTPQHDARKRQKVEHTVQQQQQQHVYPQQMPSPPIYEAGDMYSLPAPQAMHHHVHAQAAGVAMPPPAVQQQQQQQQQPPQPQQHLSQYHMQRQPPQQPYQQNHIQQNQHQPQMQQHILQQQQEQSQPPQPPFQYHPVDMPPDDTVEAYLASEMEMNQDRVLRERRKREKEEREREEREREILRAQHEYRVSQAIIQAPAYKPAGKYRSIDNKSVAERARAQHQAKLRKEGRQNDSGVGSDGEEFDGGAGSGALRGTIPFETASDRLKRERREKARKQQQQLRQGGGVGRGDEDPDAQAILSAAAAASGSGRSAAARRPRVSGLLRSAGGSGSARPLVRPASSAAGEENDGRKENDGNAGEGRYRNGNGKHAGHPSRPASSPGSGGARRTPPSGGAHAGDGRGSGESEKDGEGRGGMEQAIIDRIEREIVDNASNPVTFEDIAGLEFVKQSVTETVVFPMARPDIFQGLRAQAQGVLLFGPPGTGKTLIGKAIAYECGATFFSISASSLTSKWVGEGEKAVKCLFMVAHERQPSVVFIDEVDSLLCQRSNDENEGSRRIKTEFLVQLDGVQTNTNDLVLIMGATNRPQELDEAARRRFAKRLYVPLPDATGRACLIHKLLQGTGKTQHSLSVDELAQVVEKTKGFSGADIKALCSEAAMGPVREILARARVGAPARSASRNSGAADASTSRSSSRNGRTAASAAAAAEAAGSGENLVSGARSMLKSVSASDVKAIEYRHFEEALRSVSRSVSRADLDGYLAFNNEFGAHGADAAEEVPDDAVAAATAAAALFGCGGEGEEETEVLSA